MAYDKNISPVGWYLGSYLLRFVELEDAQRDNPDKRFEAWENTVLVKGKTLEEAYAKVEKIGREDSTPYQGGPDGVPVQWEYVGVTELLPIYEALGDGAEIAWAKHNPRKLENLRKWVRPLEAFYQ